MKKLSIFLFVLVCAMVLGRVEADLVVDHNGDGKVDVADVNTIIDKVLGK